MNSAMPPRTVEEMPRMGFSGWRDAVSRQTAMKTKNYSFTGNPAVYRHAKRQRSCDETQSVSRGLLRTNMKMLTESTSNG